MIRTLGVGLARALPASVKDWIHRYRSLDRLSRRMFALFSASGGEVIPIEDGPVKNRTLDDQPFSPHGPVVPGQLQVIAMPA
jgi:hypothetical protein